MTGILERLFQHADVVRRAAGAAGLGNHNGGVPEVVLAAVERVNELSNNENGRIARVVVDVLQPLVNDRLRAVAQDNDVISGMTERRLQQVEMYRRHLRAEDSVLLAHFLGEFRLAHIAEVTYHRLVVMALALLDYRDKRAQTYSCRAEVVYLVYLETGVQLSEAAEYLLNLIGCDSVQTAAEAVELDKLQTVVLADYVSRSVQP